MDLKLIKMDVKTSFFHGELDKMIFMSQPEGFLSKCHESKACRLKQSIYGLKLNNGIFDFIESYYSLGS